MGLTRDDLTWRYPDPETGPSLFPATGFRNYRVASSMYLVRRCSPHRSRPCSTSWLPCGTLRNRSACIRLYSVPRTLVSSFYVNQPYKRFRGGPISDSRRTVILSAVIQTVFTAFRGASLVGLGGYSYCLASFADLLLVHSLSVHINIMLAPPC